jgi:tRNA G18 (ribose-2'-O)-methylase SpoU
VLIAVKDATDPRIDVFQGLRDKSLRQRREAPEGDLAGIFIAEGDIVIERAIAAGYRLQSVLIDAKRTQPLPDQFDDVDVFAADDPVLEHIAGYHSYRGALGCFYRKELQPPEELLADTSLKSFVVVEGVNNPTNLGTIIRCAAGLDIDALILSPDSVDPLSRRCCRVSMGEGFSLPYARLNDIEQGLTAVKSSGIELLAMTPNNDATDIATLKYSDTDRVAVLLGTEGSGLTDKALASATRWVSIPMSGNADSLNVGSAAAVTFYALRQARQG